MRKLVVACAVIVLLTIVFVGAIQIYQQWGKSATRLTDENPAVLVNAELVSIVAGRDNTIFSESGKSAGAASTLFSGQNNSGSPRRALLWFNVAGSIPAGSTVHSAALILHLSRAAQTETMAPEFALHRLLSDWGEGTSGRGGPGHGRGATPDPRDATWKYRFYDSTSWTDPGGDFNATASATTSVGTGVDSYTWDSTPLMVEDVQSWLDNPTTNFGWILIGPASVNGTARRFESREATVALRPSLQVQFTPVR